MVTMQATTRALPEWQRALLSGGAASDGGRVRRAEVEEPCPRCSAPRMEFYTMQMRSADEGQTVFYECKACGHKFSVNA